MEGKLKLEKETVGEVIINVDEARLALTNCKVYTMFDGDDRIVMQLRDPDNARRTVQVTFTQYVDEKTPEEKEEEKEIPEGEADQPKKG